MSQALLLRVQALEARVAELEQRQLPQATVSGTSVDFKPPDKSNSVRFYTPSGFEPFHKGRGRYGVRGADGTEVGTEPLSKEDAEAIAKDLNEQTEAMSA